MTNNYQKELYIELDTKTNEIVSKLPNFVSKFFNQLKALGMSPKTRLQYAYDIQKFFNYLSNNAFKDIYDKFYRADEVLDVLTFDDIQEYINGLEIYKTEKGKIKLTSPSYRARQVSSLRSFYRFYFKIGDIKNNLADLMNVPKIPEKKIVIMEKEEVKRILDVINNTEGLTNNEILRKEKTADRDYAIMMLFFGTGIRVSELVGINLSDIDFYNASVLITRKGGDQDEVYFNDKVQYALEEYANYTRNVLLSGNTKEEAFFISMQHKRMTVRSVELMIKKYSKLAGLNMKITPHALRRTFGTNLYNETGDIYLVADSLHHSSVETTKRHYVQMSKDHKRIASKVSSTLFDED